MMRKSTVMPLVVLVLLWGLTGCSWQVPFLVINAHASPRQVQITLDRVSQGIPVFSARSMQLLPLEDGKADFSRGKHLGLAEAPTHSVTIPAHSALQIGQLNNDEYRASTQQFINGRVFNLASLRSGTTVVTPANFDRYFRKNAGSVTWQLD